MQINNNTAASISYLLNSCVKLVLHNVELQKLVHQCRHSPYRDPYCLAITDPSDEKHKWEKRRRKKWVKKIISCAKDELKRRGI